MQTLFRHAALVVFTCTAAACASSAKLARQSDESLAKGDLREAYDRALRAVEKDPQLQAARASYTAASTRVDADYRARILATATGDALAAADLALDHRAFRLEVARHQTAREAVPDYDATEQAILSGAARLYYRRGDEAMAAGRPKVAVGEFTTAARYDDRFEDVAMRVEEARRAATVRVALMPFADRVGIPGLAQEIADTVQRQIEQRGGREFRFTEIVSAADIERNMTVAELRNLRPDDLAGVAGRVGANWIVTGRIGGLRSTDAERTVRFPLYHRFDQKDSTGVVTSRWDEVALPVQSRQRDVTVQYDLDVIDAATGVVLAHRDRSAQVVARVVWTDFIAEQPYDRYALLPPDVRKADPRRARVVDGQWRDELGSWDLGDFLRQSRDQRARSRYSSRYRGEFYANTRETPAWFGELPGEQDLAFVALRDVWRDVFGALEELDAK